MRYAVKFNNGAWKLFDRSEYRDVGIFTLRVTAEEACAQANLEAAMKR